MGAKNTVVVATTTPYHGGLGCCSRITVNFQGHVGLHERNDRENPFILVLQGLSNLEPGSEWFLLLIVVLF